MALVTTGLTDSGSGPGRTAHYQIQYDDSLSAADGLNRANALIGFCETDFTMMSNWFGGVALTVGNPITVNISPGPFAGAGWGPPITVTPGNGSSVSLVRYLLVSEVTEMFMLARANGWGYSFGDGNEGSKGEGLSRFLGYQFLLLNAINPNILTQGGGTFLVSNSWLNSPRLDFVNNNPDDINPDPTTGCTTLFVYYLNAQLGFSISNMINAGGATLGDVYTTLTGDGGDPFPFFKQLLDNAFPGTTTIPTPDTDNPFPLGLLSFWVDKSTFGRDEVTDTIAANGGVFPNAFWLVVEGFNKTSFDNLGVTISAFSGPFAGIAGITITQSTTNPIDYEIPGNPNTPQRIRIAFDITFNNTALTSFPVTGDAEYLLSTSITVGGNVITGSNASTVFELVAGADPYFNNIDPSQNNVFWLSQDLRVFTATPSVNNMPIAGGPAFNNNTVAGAFTYAQQLLTYLNTNFSDPTGSDPFTTILPGQGNAYTDDSSVTPSTSGNANYNFAIARVRLKGTQGVSGAANNVKVFFRLWSSQTADTDYQPTTTYLSTVVNNKPQAPLVGAGNTTIPFFATGNLSGNTDYGAGGINNRVIQINTGDTVWAYFGCFLNLYDSSNLINGSNIQTLLNGTHHCIVAQIAYDDAPIINPPGLTMSPESSDKLAQRNLQVTFSDNPGEASTHRIPQTFDARPSKPLIQLPGSLLNYPDELMIDWHNTPVGSLASIYWPRVNVNDILNLASQLYGSHVLSAADPHTVQCTVTSGVTYIPIPPDSGENFAGLFTVDLPTTVVSGQEFNIIVRRISSRQNRTKTISVSSLPAASVTINNSNSVNPTNTTNTGNSTSIGNVTQSVSSNTKFSNWRYVTGTFQVRIPVTTKEIILEPEENTLAIMKWRLQNMSPTNRWYPVLLRYITYISARIDGLGGDAAGIRPSLKGNVQPGRCPEKEHEKKCDCEKNCDCERSIKRCSSKLIIAMVAWIAFWIMAIWAVVYLTGMISSKPIAVTVLFLALALAAVVNFKLIKDVWDDCK